jgi:hypothetical protein
MVCHVCSLPLVKTQAVATSHGGIVCRGRQKEKSNCFVVGVIIPLDFNM